jgi:hypothetical protein
LAAASLVLASPAGASNQSVKFTTTPIYFGAVTIGTSSSGVSLVTNTSTQPLYFVSASPGTSKTGAEYHASQGTCTGALAVGASCDIDVAFAPNTTGLRASTLTVRMGEENAKGKITAAASVANTLRGRGVKPTFTLSGASAGSVILGQLGTADASITNTSSVPLTLKGYSLEGVKNHDFAVSSISCPSPLLPGGSCDVVLAFQPRHTGSASVTLTVAMKLQGTPGTFVEKQATINGTGVLAGHASPPFTLSPLDFGTVTVGTTASGDVVLTNTSANNETFDSDAISNDKSGAYTVTGTTCTGEIASATSCDLEISYAPQAAVIHNATLVAHVTYLNAKLASVKGAAQTSLTGQGQNPQFTLMPSSFPNTTVGASSTSTVTVTNDSLVPLTYGSVAFQGADQNSWAFAGSACVGAIQPEQSCALNVAFSPRQQGTLSVTFQVTLELTVRTHTTDVVRRAALSGNGELPSLSVTAPTLAATPKGVSVSGQATVTNNSDVSLTYDGYGFSGPNANDFVVTGGTCSGATIGPSASCDLTVQFTPSASSPGSESATLKVTMAIPGTNPVIDTSNSVAVSGQES